MDVVHVFDYQARDGGAVRGSAARAHAGVAGRAAPGRVRSAALWRAAA